MTNPFEQHVLSELTRQTGTIDLALRKLMEISGSIESVGMMQTSVNMRKHIATIDDAFSELIGATSPPHEIPD